MLHKDYIKYLNSILEDATDLAEVKENINIFERALSYSKEDPSRAGILDKSSTRASLSRASSRLVNRFRVRNGFERWLKLRGKKDLSKTANKRFESLEFEDVKLLLSRNLISTEDLISKFTSIDLSPLQTEEEKLESLFKNHYKIFFEILITECDKLGIVLDLIDEDTVTANVATTNGGDMANRSPWYVPDREKEFWYPHLVYELKHSFNEISKSEDDMEITSSLNELQEDLNSAMFSKDFMRLENLFDYVEKEFQINELLPESQEYNIED